MARKMSFRMKRLKEDPGNVVGTSTEGGQVHDQMQVVTTFTEGGQVHDQVQITDTAIVYQNVSPVTHEYEQVDIPVIEDTRDPTYDYPNVVLLREADGPSIGASVSQLPDKTQPAGNSTAEQMAVVKEDNGDALNMDAGKNRSSVTLTANPSYHMVVTTPVAQQSQVQHTRAYVNINVSSGEQGTSMDVS